MHIALYPIHHSPSWRRLSAVRRLHNAFPRTLKDSVAAENEAADRVREAPLNGEKCLVDRNTDRRELLAELRVLLDMPDAEFRPHQVSTAWAGFYCVIQQQQYGLHPKPRPHQEAAALVGLNDADIILDFPTSAGKSATFWLPALVAKRRRDGTSQACPSATGATLVIQMHRSIITDQAGYSSHLI